MSGPAANPYMAAQRAWDDTGDWEMAVEAALTVARQRVAEPQPAPELAYAGDDVHVDWHMTPGEWRQLYTALWAQADDTPYIARLIEAGKIPAPFGERAQ